MERKNTVLLTVIAVATLLVAVIGATFAYFTATAGGSGTTPVSVTTSSVGATSFTNTSIVLTVQQSDMNQADGKSDHSKYTDKEGAAATSFTKTVPKATTAQKATCSVKITYTPTSADALAYTMTSGAGKEMTILYKPTLTNATFTPAATYTGTLLTADDNNKLDAGWYELQLPKTATDLVTGNVVITGTTAADVTGTVSYQLKMRFYNLGIDQSLNANKSFGGNVNFSFAADTYDCTYTNA